MSEGNLGSIGKNLITTSPYTIYQAGLLAWLVTGDNKYGFFTLLAIVMGDGFNAIEKQIAKQMMGNDVGGERPSGCGSEDGSDCTGCGICM